MKPQKDAVEPQLTKLSDLEWGGRVRRAFQERVAVIATKAARSRTRWGDGSLLSSSESTLTGFLDGGLRITRGYFDTSSGMFLQGRLARAFVVYELGSDAREVLKDRGLPSRRDLKAQVRADQDKAGGPGGTTT